MNWRPIDTAPKTGEAILLRQGGKVSVGYHNAGSVAFDILPHWRCSGHYLLWFTPDEWCPIPIDEKDANMRRAVSS